MPVCHTDIQAIHKQFVSICNEVSPGLKLRKRPLDGAEALGEQSERCLFFNALRIIYT